MKTDTKGLLLAHFGNLFLSLLLFIELNYGKAWYLEIGAIGLGFLGMKIARERRK